MNMSKKLLIGCPTHESKNYSILLFCKFLKEAVANRNDCDVLFVDNSKDPKHQQTIEKVGFEVVKNTMEYQSKIESIVSSRNIIINRCLEGGYERLLFLDTDLLIPQETIDYLLKENKDIIGGVYLGGQKIGNEVKLAPVFFKSSKKGKEFVEIPGANEVMGNKVMEVAAIGFGCCMIKSKVLQRIRLRYDKVRNCAEDIFFCFDAREYLNIPTFVHTGVKCVHLVQQGTKIIPYEFRPDLDK